MNVRLKATAVGVLLAILFCFTGCRPLVDSEPKTISVYATFFPIYVLTDAVMKDIPYSELHCLVQPQDGCLRKYQLSDWDIYLLSAGADAVIAGGRGLESFESTLFAWDENGPAVSAVLYNLELYNQDDRTDGERESHIRGANPHLYISLEGALQIVESICASLQSFDPDYADCYLSNTDASKEKLTDLLEQNRSLLSAFVGREVVLMNESLIYIAQDYGLKVSDWIDRESGEGMGDREIETLLRRLSDIDAGVILIERQAPQQLTDAIENAGYTVARLDILSTHQEGEGFERYLEVQRENAQIIYDAFSREDDKEVSMY